jgi:DNA-binding response OmpR family regulator
VHRVLVADDDPAIRQILVTNLLAEGLDVAAVDDGRAAYEHALRDQPDLVVLDVMMPVHDGITALRQLKADPRTAGIPVVLLTARASDQEIWEGWEAGADYYITKPFDIDDLLKFIAYVGLEPV